MNFAFLYSYSTLNKVSTENAKSKHIEYFYFSLNFFVYSLIISNDFSIYSFQILNFIKYSEFHGNLTMDYRRALMIKEFSIFKTENLFFLFSTRSYKNFGYWNSMYWLTQKEFYRNICLLPDLLVKFERSEPKNFHLWSFLINFIFFTDSKLVKNTILSELLGSLDIFNESLWHLKLILTARIKKLSSACLSIFLNRCLTITNESKWKFINIISKSTKFLNCIPLILSNVVIIFILNNYLFN
nr:farnesyltransferase/geranylgeranyltransferase type-1 subunit alpha [Cryptomonas sp.]